MIQVNELSEEAKRAGIMFFGLIFFKVIESVPCSVQSQCFISSITVVALFQISWSRYPGIKIKVDVK